MAGCDISNSDVNSFTERGAAASKERISLRAGCAIALKTAFRQLHKEFLMDTLHKEYLISKQFKNVSEAVARSPSGVRSSPPDLASRK